MDELKKTNAVLKEMIEPLKLIENTTDLKGAALTLDEIFTNAEGIGADGQPIRFVAHDIATSTPTETILKESTGFEKSMEKSRSMIKAKAGNPRALLFKSITLMALTGTSFAPQAAEAFEVGNRVDPFQLALTAVEDLYDSRCKNDSNDIFLRDPDHNCSLDFSMSDRNTRLLEYNPDHLANLLSTHPEVCEFI